MPKTTPFRTRLPGVLPFVVVLVASLTAVIGAQDTRPRPPAPTLSTPSGTSASPDAAGFLRRWMVLEPITVSPRLSDSAVREAVTTAYFPNQLSVLPADGDQVTAGDTTLTWHAVDTINYNVNLYHFAWALERPTSNVLFWVVTTVNAPREMTDVRLAIGSNAASVWWLNDAEVIALYNDRQAVVDDGVSDRVTLRQGPNVIRAAIINAGGATDFCARLLDANDDPITSVSVSLPGGTR
jgi:hypothetical protein